MPSTYVAIDLETTGLDPHREDIIEVGAVRFCDDEVQETFRTFVRPVRPLPREVQALTGIKPADLRDAPPFAAIAADLEKMIGALPVVAQSAPFDLAFLAEHGLPLTNPYFDTLDLAKILVPQLPERNLGALAAHFGISYPVRHRALPDAIAVKDVFLALREHALTLDPAILNALVSLGPSSGGWTSGAFFREVLEESIARGLERSVRLGGPGLRRLGDPSGAPLPERGTPLRIAGGRDWPGAIEATPATGQSAQQAPGLPGARQSAPRSPRTQTQRRPLDPAALAALLGPDGPVARTFPGFEHRTEQVAMVEAVAEAFNARRHLIVEAGTGTGKSMAYLLPALTHALQNNATVVISTNTIALQEQIVQKDIPALLRALGASAEDSGLSPQSSSARYAQLKGRSNYICLRRWQDALSGRLPGNIDASLMARIIVWLAVTTTGDRAELNLNSAEMGAWSRISAEAGACSAGQCLQLREGECFLMKARARAAEAHLVVVNHALLLADMAAGNTILPEHEYLVIDEAHHLEDIATDQFGFRLSLWEAGEFFDRLVQEAGGRQFGLLPDIQAAIRTAGPLFSASSGLSEQIGSLADRVGAARARSDAFFAILADYLQAAGGSSEYGRRLRLVPAARRHPNWAQVEHGWEDFRLVLQDILARLERIAGQIKSLNTMQDDLYESLLADMESAFNDGNQLLAHGAAAVANPDPDWVIWAATLGQEPAPTRGSSSPARAAAGLFAAPIEVGSMLKRELFDKKGAIILTSATLQTAHSFAYVNSRLGLENPHELAVGSSFPYKEAALVLVPRDVPHPQHPSHAQALQAAINDLCLASEGRALVLFTSYASLDATYRALRRTLEPAGYRVLAQGASGNVQRLLEQLRSQPKTVLLGTSSFWEGVDVVGDALSLLIITRLPFTVPTEPVFAARSERFQNPFEEYAIPQAVLRFRQGFGRLIRSRTDRGVAVVLDPRVAQKNYGRAFLGSLPPATFKQCLLREAPRYVTDWLNRSRGPG